MCFYPLILTRCGGCERIDFEINYTERIGNGCHHRYRGAFCPDAVLLPQAGRPGSQKHIMPIPIRSMTPKQCNDCFVQQRREICRNLLRTCNAAQALENQANPYPPYPPRRPQGTSGKRPALPAWPGPDHHHRSTKIQKTSRASTPGQPRGPLPISTPSQARSRGSTPGTDDNRNAMKLPAWNRGSRSSSVPAAGSALPQFQMPRSIRPHRSAAVQSTGSGLPVSRHDSPPQVIGQSAPRGQTTAQLQKEATYIARPGTPHPKLEAASPSPSNQSSRSIEENDEYVRWLANTDSPLPSFADSPYNLPDAGSSPASTTQKGDMPTAGQSLNLWEAFGSGIEEKDSS